MAGNEQGTAVDHGQHHAALPRVGGVENRLADFVAHLPGFAYIIRRDASGRFGLPFVSPGFEDKFGISHDSVRDDIRPLRARYHADDRARIESAFDASAELLTPLIVEYRAFHPLRGTFWIETRAAPQAQDDGSILWHGIALDITDRKQVEEELCAREREFRTVAESSIDLIFRYDRHCRRIYVNPAVCKLMGRSREALLGGLPSDNTLMLPGEQGQAYMAAIRQVFQSGCVGRFLMAFPLSGTIVHYDVQLIPELDASGEVASVYGVARDVSLLKDAERRTDRYFAGMPGFAFTLRVPPQGRWTLPFVSRGIDDLYGLCPDDVRDNASRLLEVVHPDDRPLLAEQQRTALRTRQPFQVEFRLQRPGHDTRWVECRAMCEEDLDGALAWHGVVLDINERRGLEEQMLKERATLSAFFRTLPALAWIKDVEGRYLACNPQFEQFFGASEHAIVGKTDFDFVDGELARFFREKDLLALTAGSACVNEEWVTFASDGRRALLETVKAPVRDANGKVVGVLGVAHDITERQRVQQTLADREAFLASLLDAIPVPVFYKDRQGRYRGFNSAYERFFGVDRQQLIGNTVFDLHQPELARTYHQLDEELYASDTVQVHDSQASTGDGELRDVVFCKGVLRDRERQVIGLVGTMLDITDRKRMEGELARREQEFRTLVEHSTDTVARYGPDMRRRYVNPAFAAKISGGAAALLGKTPSESPGGEQAKVYESMLQQVFETRSPAEFELHWTDRDGLEACSHISLTPEFEESSGQVASVLAVGRDITELHHVRQKIHKMAFYDSLTGLPNRALLMDRLRQMLTDASWHKQQAAVMMIDLDRFKGINDTLGHAAGDALLREAAARLGACVRIYDTVARLGGDEFAVLIPEVRSGEDVARVAGEMLERFGDGFLLDGKEVFVSCSIGIVLYPDDGGDADELLRNADTAMYQAKHSGRNGFAYYSRELTASAQERLLLEAELRRAIGRGELELYYQPKVNLTDGVMVGSEALLRWMHPSLGMIPPDRFIPVAEDSGLIVEIGKWVLRKACRTAALWNGDGQPVHKIAVNLSARQFQASGLQELVAETLFNTRCRPEWIELEITESLLLDEDGKVLETLCAFRSMGVSIAIDDFGTGYSALSYLARFPIDTLKIDRSFIHSVTTDTYRAELVRAILSIARCLGQVVVAEGVETLEQAAFLEANGCQLAQGYLFSRPLPETELAALPGSFKP